MDNFVFWITNDNEFDGAESNVCPYVDRKCHIDCRALKHSDAGWICTREQNDAIAAHFRAMMLEQVTKEWT